MATFTIGKSVFKMGIAEGTAAVTDLSQYVSNVKFHTERPKSEIKVIGGNPTTQIIGNAVASYTVEGPWDPTFHGYITGAFSATSPTTRPVEVGFGGTATSSPKETASVYIASYEPTGDGGDPTKYTMDLVVAGSVSYSTY